MVRQWWGGESWAAVDRLLRQLERSGFPLTIDLLIALAYAIILAALIYLIYRKSMTWVGRSLALLFALAALVGAAGKTLVVFKAAPALRWLDPGAGMVAEGVIVLICLVIWPIVLRIARQPSPKILQREIDVQLSTLQELRDVRGVLEQQVAARTAQLHETTERFETVLRQAPISVFSHDKNLRYTWVRNPPAGFPDEVVGKTDEQILPKGPAAQLMDVKRRAMECGEALRTEIALAAGDEQHWYDFTVEPVRAVDGSIVGTTSAAVDISHRKKNEELLQLLLKEVTHRSKNLLSVIQGIVRHAGPGATTGTKFASRLSGRLRALATTHDLLVDADWRGVSLAALVRAQLAIHSSGNGVSKQVRIDGPDLIVGSVAADCIGLVVHELLENALEFGALAVPTGSVAVSWKPARLDGGENLMFAWVETGGPAVEEPTRSGFGRKLLEEAIGMSLTADVALEFQPDGVRCEIILPSYHVIRSHSLVEEYPTGMKSPAG